MRDNGATPPPPPPPPPHQPQYPPQHAPQHAYSPGSYAYSRSRNSAFGTVLGTMGILVGLVVAVGLGYVLLTQDRGGLTIRPIADQELKQGDKLRMQIPVDVEGIEPEQLSFSVAGAPPGMRLNAKTGELSWSPIDVDKPGDYEMTVKVDAAGERPRSVQRSFKIRLIARAKLDLAPSQEMVNMPAKVVDENPFETTAEVTPMSPLDELVFAKLKELKIEPANMCSDAVFVRRIFLDMLGTLPTKDEVKDFLQDKSPDKRRALVERVLQRPEYADFWALKWADVFRVKAEFPINLWPNAAQAYHHWLMAAMRDNMPYDKFVRQLLTSSGSNFRVPQVNFYRAVQIKTPASLAQAAALAFMGERAEKWPKERLQAMAAFFSQIGYKTTGEWKEEIVMWDTRRAVAAAKGGGKPEKPGAKPDAAPVPPAFPDGTTVELTADKDPREVFADWLIRPENPWFSRQIVNRMWYWLLGRGIVHEPDDIRPDNPAQNPELLNYLAAELVKSQYDLRHIFRLILNSRTYQLSPVPKSKDPRAAENFAYYGLRRLEAEVIIDALCQLTGTTEFYMSIIPEPYSYIPEDLRSIKLPDGSITSAFLETFGRPPRDSGLESERNNRISANQRLHLLNSTHVRDKIEKGSKMRELLESTTDSRQMAETLYMALLSRLPTEEEWDTVQGYCGSRMGGQIVAWALINSEEFIFRH